MPLTPFATRLLATTALALCASYLGACKKLASKSKGVDALLAQEREHGDCGPGDALDDKASPEQHLTKAYGALPGKLKTWFPDVKSSYILDNDNTICTNLLKGLAANLKPSLEDRVSYVEACWKSAIRNDSSKDSKGNAQNIKMPIPVVHITKDARTIHRNILPMSVYAFAEFYVDKLLGPAVEQTKKQMDKDTAEERALRNFINVFRNARTTLTSTFLDELDQRAEHKAILASYLDFYKQDKESLKKNLLFQNFVIAEFVDAYYCSPTTRGQLVEKGLPNTKGAFAYFVDTFGQPWKL